MRKMLTKGDVMLFAILLVVTLGSFFLLHALRSPGTLVIIELKGNAVYKGLLAEDRKITINAAYGNVRIQIKDNKVAVVYAECSDKTCVRSGWRAYAGESILCLPNQLIIHILGEENNEVSLPGA